MPVSPPASPSMKWPAAARSRLASSLECADVSRQHPIPFLGSCAIRPAAPTTKGARMSDYGSPPPPPPPPPPYGGYGAPGSVSPPPPNYLVWAILSTVLCFLPLGVVSIVFSTQVNSKWAMGDWAGAQEASKKAKNFAIWSAIAWVVLGVLAMIFFFGLLATSSTIGS